MLNVLKYDKPKTNMHMIFVLLTILTSSYHNRSSIQWLQIPGVKNVAVQLDNADQ